MSNDVPLEKIRTAYKNAKLILGNEIPYATLCDFYFELKKLMPDFTTDDYWRMLQDMKGSPHNWRGLRVDLIPGILDGYCMETKKRREVLPPFGMFNFEYKFIKIIPAPTFG